MAAANDPHHSNDSSSAEKDEPSSSDGAAGVFECNICLDTAKDAVVSFCGHLFCWPCLHQWLETRPNKKMCPVCKAGISKEKVVPLYGRGSSKQEDPREKKLPPRPSGQRSEPETSHSFQSAFPAFGLPDNGFHMSFGIGAFPFGFLLSSFNYGDGRQNAGMQNANHHENSDEQFLSKIFLWVAILFILWLFIA